MGFAQTTGSPCCRSSITSTCGWTSRGTAPPPATCSPASLLLASSASPRPSAEGPTLVDGFDAAAGRRAASMEQALLVTARALDCVPGAKSLVVFGHGFGRILIGDGRAPAGRR